MFSKLNKKYFSISSLLTVFYFGISQGAESKWDSIDMIRSYQNIEKVVFDEFSTDLKKIVNKMFESKDFKKNYEITRSKNTTKPRDICNELIEQFRDGEVNRLKMQTIKRLESIPYSDLEKIPYRDNIQRPYIGVASRFSLTYFLEPTSNMGFVKLTGAYGSLTDPRDKVEKFLNEAVRSKSDFWSDVTQSVTQKVEQEKSVASFPGNLKLAKLGNANAQCNVGVAYYKGEGVNKDVRTARSWFEKSAEQGLWQPMSWLGTIYYNSEGGTYEEGPIHVRRSAALKWWRRAKDYGCTYADGEIDMILQEARQGGYLNLIQ